VIGAGVAGLTTAWFLQQRGVSVTVYDRGDVGAGSSRGNAGWIVPGLVEPLPSPAVLKSVVPALLSRSSPLRIPITPDLPLLRFLASSARHCTGARWRKSMRSLGGITSGAIAAFDGLADGGVDVDATPAKPFLACFRRLQQREAMSTELAHMQRAGQSVSFTAISGDAARAVEPCLSDQVAAAIAVDGQQFLDPMAFVQSLARAVQSRGATIRVGREVSTITDNGRQVLVTAAGDDCASFDAVVVATGAWLSQLSRPFGVRMPVHAGRGYSFSVAVRPTPTHPIYFPAERIACTPIDGRLRVAGMMEFRDADAPFDERRIAAVARAAAPMLQGANFEDRREDWAGSRPCTADGLPLIGASESPRVFVCGGHGMWGLVLGPVSGLAIAELVTTGRTSPSLAPFNPLRKRRARL
jgi:D-amino-acid dehydrogenase